jgi:NAD(P)-dependent dehydrogenase (short-subunit alcohol dehydrogenase family)
MTMEDGPIEHEHLADGGLGGKAAIVTGAGSQGPGIGNGRAIAVLLANAGARVCLLDSSEENLGGTVELLDAAGAECMTVTADVTSAEDCERAVSETVGAWGSLDVLINNVGVAGPIGDVAELDLDAWKQCFEVNVTSMVLMSRFALAPMRKAGGGSIVNMSSVAGLVGGAPLLAYSASKGAINVLTKVMATQHGPEGIRVNAVAPGMVYTPMVAAHGMSDEERKRRRLAAPLGVEGTGWDVAEAVLFLVGSNASWVNGVVLTVDAGLTAVGVSPGATRYSTSDQG